MDVVRFFYHDDHVEVCRLYEEVADGNGIEELSCCEAALDDGEAEGVAEQQEPLLDAEGAKEDAAVGVVFHRLCHGERIGGGEVSCEVDLVAERRGGSLATSPSPFLYVAGLLASPSLLL